jgi:flavin-binding protein dodecin
VETGGTGISAQALKNKLIKRKGARMSKTYKMIELIGASPKSYAEATRNAVEEASKSIKAMGWFEVVELGGRIEDGRISEFQSKIKVGFRLLDEKELNK